MARSKPIQKRSRERVENILLAAADELAKAGSADQLTTLSVAERSGVPASTIYRYFLDRYEIIAALVDRELAEIDTAIADELKALETVNVSTLIDAVVKTQFEHFLGNQRAVLVWFGARGSKKVLERVQYRYAALGKWTIDGAVAAGFAKDDYPKWGGEAIAWICDRGFEFALNGSRSITEQREIVDEVLTAVKLHVDIYVTDRGRAGVPSAEFLANVVPIEQALARPEPDG